jgi:hypothetical protein
MNEQRERVISKLGFLKELSAFAPELIFRV